MTMKSGGDAAGWRQSRPGLHGVVVRKDRFQPFLSGRKQATGDTLFHISMGPGTTMVVERKIFPIGAGKTGSLSHGTGTVLWNRTDFPRSRQARSWSLLDD
jgi:hypothetical protein